MMPHILVVLVASSVAGGDLRPGSGSGGREPHDGPAIGGRRPRAHRPRLRLATQPSLLTCVPREMPRAPGGTSAVIDDPAATYAPAPIRTGAISWLSLPMNAPSSMIVGFLFTPS